MALPVEEAQGTRCRERNNIKDSFYPVPYVGISLTSFGSVRVTVHNHSGSEHKTDGDPHEKYEDVTYEHFLSPIKYRLGSNCDPRDSRAKHGPYPGFCQ